MLFNSIEFFVFFGSLLLLYYYVPKKYKWLLLLIVSYYFYMSWRWQYIILIIISTLVDYFVAKAIFKTNIQFRKRVFLSISLIANLGMLFYFKYYNFFIDSVNSSISIFSGFTIPYAEIILPVGLSFYTFQTISYTLEVYYGRQEPERHLGKFALFVSYFPQLVAGPIERPQNLLHQLNDPKPLMASNFVSGARLILWGLFKKVVVADRLAYFVDVVYNNPDSYHGLSIVIATVFFAFQIYCDFSGYSDMAIGVARIMGVDLMKNFRTPYFSTSVREFWGRWHISLSTWFRDYVYIPLGGNRAGMNKWIVNLFITFLISGIWHGANWTFIIWGAIHGLIIAFEAINSKKKFINIPLPTLLKTGLTFSIVCFAWIFFRANNVSDAFLIISNIFTTSYSFIGEVRSLNTMTLYNLALGFPLIILLLLLEKGWGMSFVRGYFYSHKPFRFACYVSLIAIIALFGVFVNQSSFIYFQF